MAWVMASRYVVSAIPITILDIESARGVGGIGHRRAIRFIGRGVDLLLHALLDAREVFFGGDAELAQHALEARQSILGLPLLDLLGRHVCIVDMLGLSLHSVVF